MSKFTLKCPTCFTLIGVAFDGDINTLKMVSDLIQMHRDACKDSFNFYISCHACNVSWCPHSEEIDKFFFDHSHGCELNFIVCLNSEESDEDLYIVEENSVENNIKSQNV